MSCHPESHNRFSPRYSGSMEIIRIEAGGHRERCSICGQEFLQLYSVDREVGTQSDRTKDQARTDWSKVTIWAGGR